MLYRYIRPTSKHTMHVDPWHGVKQRFALNTPAEKRQAPSAEVIESVLFPKPWEQTPSMDLGAE